MPERRDDIGPGRYDAPHSWPRPSVWPALSHLSVTLRGGQENRYE